MIRLLAAAKNFNHLKSKLRGIQESVQLLKGRLTLLFSLGVITNFCAPFLLHEICFFIT